MRSSLACAALSVVIVAACSKPAPAPPSSASLASSSAMTPSASRSEASPSSASPSSASPSSASPSSASVTSGSASSASSSPAVAPRLDLSPFTISFRGQRIAQLFADGRTVSVGPNAPGTEMAPGPTLHADGTITMTKGGVTARLDDEGHLYVTSPSGPEPRERLFGRIADDRLTVAGSRDPWRVRVEGNLIEFSKDDSSQIDGEVTPAIRHTALVMAAAFTIDNAILAR